MLCRLFRWRVLILYNCWLIRVTRALDTTSGNAMIFIENARLHVELENISFCYAHQLVNLMIDSPKPFSNICSFEGLHLSKFISK